MLYLLPLLMSATTAGTTPAEAPPKAANETPEFAGLTLPPQDDEPMNEWTGTVNLGAIFTSGNVESTALSAAVDLAYRRKDDRFTFGAWGTTPRTAWPRTRAPTSPTVATA